MINSRGFSINKFIPDFLVSNERELEPKTNGIAEGISLKS